MLPFKFYRQNMNILLTLLLLALKIIVFNYNKCSKDPYSNCQITITLTIFILWIDMYYEQICLQADTLITWKNLPPDNCSKDVNKAYCFSDSYVTGLWSNLICSECTVNVTLSSLNHKPLEKDRQRSVNVLNDGYPRYYWSLNSEPIHSELANIFHIFLENIEWLLISDKTVLSIATQSTLATTYCIPLEKLIL